MICPICGMDQETHIDLQDMAWLLWHFYVEHGLDAIPMVDSGRYQCALCQAIISDAGGWNGVAQHWQAEHPDMETNLYLLALGQQE